MTIAIFNICLVSYFIVFSLALPHNLDKISSSQQVSKRNFEPWLSKNKHKVTFSISKFGDITPFHKNEMAHLYQGDILGFGGQMVMTNDGKQKFKVNLWPDGIVPYVITGDYSKDNIFLIKGAMKKFEIHTCIRFVKRTDEKDYIDIQSKTSQCSSYVGRLSRKGAQAINLATNGCMSTSTVTHELMHALGFRHEQSRPDRDDYVTINWKNIKKGKEWNFAMDDESWFQDLGVPYDIGSVMQYKENAFSISRDKPTITANNGKKLGNYKGLSKSDIVEINKLYNCKRKVQSKGTTNS